MSKFHLLCSCINCKVELTVQSLKAHTHKCLTVPKNICKCCEEPTTNLEYCSHSCRATIVNSLRIKKPKLHIDRSIKTLERFSLGLIFERATIRKCLTKLKGYNCSICDIASWNDKPIILIVDHIDGNAGNNDPTNLQLLCPNCNSQSSTFSGRNKGNGRKSRGLPLN